MNTQAQGAAQPSAAASADDDIAKRFVSNQEFVVEAKRRLDPHVWDYLVGGSESETTLARNRLALDRVAFRPRVLRDVSKVDTSTVLFRRKMRIPVFTAPVGGMVMFDPDGAAAAARGVAARGCMTMLSSVTTPDLETVAAVADGGLMFQLYVRGDAAWVDAYVERALKAGVRAFCLTVDTDAYSRRERNVINRFVGRGDERRRLIMVDAGREHQQRFNWSDIARIRKKCPVPLILKGIATAEDARIALDHGVDGIYVSNHGGRQLDHGQGTLDMLPPVVDAVAGRAEVLIDGGFVRGTDVLKAVALGAKAVGIGKLMGWALSAAGEAGVARMLEILEDEMVRDMMLIGVTKLSELDPSYVCPAEPVCQPSAFSAFPWAVDQGVGKT
jgi:glycolate oxidase